MVTLTGRELAMAMGAQMKLEIAGSPDFEFKFYEGVCAGLLAL